MRSYPYCEARVQLHGLQETVLFLHLPNGKNYIVFTACLRIHYAHNPEPGTFLASFYYLLS